MYYPRKKLHRFRTNQAVNKPHDLTKQHTAHTQNTFLQTYIYRTDKITMIELFYFREFEHCQDFHETHQSYVCFIKVLCLANFASVTNF